MTAASSSKVVLVVTGLLVVYALVERHFNPTDFDLYKQLWAIGAVALGLSVLSDFVPQVAGPFAVLVGIAMVVRRPGALGGLIGGATSPSSKGTKATTQPGISPDNKRYAPGNPSSARPG